MQQCTQSDNNMAQTTNNPLAYGYMPESPERKQRELTREEKRVRNWIRTNHGVLSKIARDTGKSVSFVQRIAYNREAQSKGLIVEHALLKEGCPLIQRIK